MDELICCLLQLCCSPLERRQKLVGHYKTLGLDDHSAEVVSDDLIARVDALLAGGVGHTLNAIFAHGSEKKG